MSAAPLDIAAREAAKRQHKAGNSQTARLVLPAPIGEVLCGVVVVGDTAYCFTRGATLVAPAGSVTLLGSP